MESLEYLLAHGNQLTGPIPHGVGYLSNLRELLLHENRIDGTLPDTLGGMHYLHTMDLRENSLSGTIPPALGLMPRLKTFTAQQNLLSGSLPSTLGLLQALTKMELQENALQGPLPSTLGLMSALTLLNMSHNNLSHAMPMQLGHMSTLEHLILNDNTPGLGALVPSASGSIPNSLVGLSSVKTLALENNAFSGFLPSFLQGDFSAERQVQLTGNPFYCPLEPWALQNYSGIHCLHCPGEVTADYTQTCSGHGYCKDGTECICDPEWSGFSTDCSQLACPSTEVTTATSDTPVLQFCNGVGICYNTVNTSIVCPANPSESVYPANDYVSFSVDCTAGVITLARCQCPPGTIPPDCATFTATEASNELVTSGAFMRPPRRIMSHVLLTVVLCYALLC